MPQVHAISRDINRRMFRGRQLVSKADNHKEKPQLQANFFIKVHSVLSHENNLETICWAAALINKLFIVRKWLGQRLNINPNRKHIRSKNQSRLCYRNPGLCVWRREGKELRFGSTWARVRTKLQHAGCILHVLTNGYLLLFSE